MKPSILVQCSEHSALDHRRSGNVAELGGGTVRWDFESQRATRKGDPRLSSSSRRRRLELKRWRGPAILLALEGHSGGGPPLNAFLSFKGQVTKCCVGHIRQAGCDHRIVGRCWPRPVGLPLLPRTSRMTLISPNIHSIPEEQQVAEDEAPCRLASAPAPGTVS